MKIKADFITNSSSTAFAIWGVLIGYDDPMYKIFEKNAARDFDIDISEVDAGHIIEYLYSTSLEAHWPEDRDNILIGLNPNEMQNDQTLFQFKQQISDELYKLDIDVSPNIVKFHYGEYYS